MYEQRDVELRPLVMTGAGLAALGAVVYFVVWLLFGYLSHRAASESVEPTYPLAAAQGARLPPEPRLQVNPRQDLRDERAEEDDILNGYRWVDRNAGIVRIPIDDAMRLTLERGLPSRPPATPEVTK